MSETDRLHWDQMYRVRGGLDREPATAPADFAALEDRFPTHGAALDIACGRGGAAVWLARRGLTVWGFDVSAVAVEHARELATRRHVSDGCRFSTVDLDDGLPAGPPVDVIVCHRFRAPHLYEAIINRLKPAGLLAISVLSEVGAGPGRFRAAPGELVSAFAPLVPVATGEADGIAWLLARRD